MTLRNLSIAGAALLLLATAGCAGRSAKNRGTEIVERAPEDATTGAHDVDPASQRDAVPSAAERLGALGAVYFAFDSHLLAPASRDVLARAAELVPELGPVLVAGHADERGTTQYNLALGARRAESVRSYLVELGVDPRQLRTVSYGEEHPAAEGWGDEVWSRNRRVELSPGAGTM